MRHAPSTVPAEPPPKEDVTLADVLVVLADGKWLIALSAAVTLAVGVLYALLATPVYSADVLVQVEEKRSGTGLGEQLSALFSESSPTETEIEILRSRAILGAVVDELNLDLTVAPRFFPVWGRAIASRHTDPEPAPAPLGLARYAWGGERITVQRLEVPPELEGKELTLVSGEKGRFAIQGPEQELLLNGEVGRTSGAGERGGVRVFVSELIARPGTEFRLVKASRSAAVAGLRYALSISEVGKKTGMIRLELEGPNPRRIAATVDSLARAYLRQNVDRKSAEAQQTLEFLEKQLPIQKANVDAAEVALNFHRSQNGNVDLSLETQGRLQRAVEVEKLLSELEVQRVELRQRFTENHPALLVVQQKMAQLQGERAGIEAKIKQLPRAEMEAARLTRDEKVANELYVILLNKAQELRVVKSGTIGNVRIVDAAVMPDEPVSPKKAASIIAALLFGLGLGVMLAFARRAIDRGVEDPDLIEQRLGLGVYAAVPYSRRQLELERSARRNAKSNGASLLATDDASDVAVESLRSLRTSLEFALVEAPSRVLMVGGPSPGVGKSFIALNLATVLAETGKRVLVMDADMRKGRLHRQFGFGRSPGLSEVISGTASIDDAVLATPVANVSLLPTGRVPPNPSELLASERFRNIVAELSNRFDLVLVDTAPILAVTDATLIGRIADMTLIVLRSGRHPIREIALAVKRLAQSGVRPHGFILNAVVPRSGALGSKYTYHYQYEYK